MSADSNEGETAADRTPVVIFARGVVDEDKRPEFLRRVLELSQIAGGESGTLAWNWHTDRSDPSVLWVHEIYADLDALAVHRENVRGLLRPFGACFLEPPVPHRCAPLAIRGVVSPADGRGSRD